MKSLAWTVISDKRGAKPKNNCTIDVSQKLLGSNYYLMEYLLRTLVYCFAMACCLVFIISDTDHRDHVSARELLGSLYM